jgi:hypothetical protein
MNDKDDDERIDARSDFLRRLKKNRILIDLRLRNANRDRVTIVITPCEEEEEE